MRRFWGTLLASNCILVGTFFCQGQESQSALQALGLGPSRARYQVSEIYNESVTGATIRADGATSIRITASLTNVDVADFTADTVFELSFARFQHSWRLGDDPSYVSGSSSVTFVDGSSVSQTGRVAVSWTPSTLTVNLSRKGDHLWGVDEPVLTFDLRTASPGATSGTTTAGVRLGEWSDSRPVVYAGTVSRRVVNAYGRPTPLLAATVAGQSDITPPTVKITAPAPNAQLADPSVTVTGTASDNAAVVQVQVGVNGGPFETATGTNSWSLPGVALRPGPNIIRARSTDSSGNPSSVASVTVVYVMNEPLRVQAVGQGTFLPNYNDALLELNRSYSITAAPSPGSRFDHWLVETNWDDATAVSNRTLRFVMQPNLALTAVFVDVTRPSVTILNPANTLQVTQPAFQAYGSARDNVGVSNVWCRLNNDPWTRADGTAAWAAWLSLNPGSNWFQVYAEDAAGNRSPTNRMTCFYRVLSPLTLITNGWGVISRVGFTSNQIEIGRSYAVIALSAGGQVFAGWSGTLASTNNPLAFIMQSNLVLEANFVPNPFLPLEGDYAGLFYPADLQGEITGYVDPTNSGLFTLNLTSDGAFSGKLVLQGTNLHYSGAFGLDLQSTVNVGRPGREALPMSLAVDPDLRVVTGSIVCDPERASAMLARRVASGSSNSLAGTYTLFLEGCTAEGACFVGTNVPLGDCPATVTLHPRGMILMSGSLADGTLINQTAAISEDGYWPLYLSLYGGSGLLLGWLSFTQDGGISLVEWKKAPSPSDRFFPDGFSFARVALVTPYAPPPPGHNVVPWTNGIVIASAGGLPVDLTNQVQIINNRVVVLGGGISNLTLTVSPNNGLFRGSFRHPVTGTLTTVNGAIVQASPDFFYMASGGWFLDTTRGGTIRFYPQ